MGDDVAVHEPSAWYLWLHGLPPQVRAVGTYVVAIPVVVAAFAALGWLERWPVALVVMVVFGLQSWFSARPPEGDPARSFDRIQRRRVERTRFTGVPDGDPVIDTAAGSALARDDFVSQWYRFGGVRAWQIVVLAGVASIFTAAAVRAGWWWALVGTLDVSALAAIGLPGTSRRPTAALARFTSDVDDPLHLDG